MSASDGEPFHYMAATGPSPAIHIEWYATGDPAGAPPRMHTVRLTGVTALTAREVDDVYHTRVRPNVDFLGPGLDEGLLRQALADALGVDREDAVAGAARMQAERAEQVRAARASLAAAKETLSAASRENGARSVTDVARGTAAVGGAVGGMPNTGSTRSASGGRGRHLRLQVPAASGGSPPRASGAREERGATGSESSPGSPVTVIHHDSGTDSGDMATTGAARRRGGGGLSGGGKSGGGLSAGEGAAPVEVHTQPSSRAQLLPPSGGWRQQRPAVLSPEGQAAAVHSAFAESDSEDDVGVAGATDAAVAHHHPSAALGPSAAAASDVAPPLPHAQQHRRAAQSSQRWTVPHGLFLDDSDSDGGADVDESGSHWRTKAGVPARVTSRGETDSPRGPGTPRSRRARATGPWATGSTAVQPSSPVRSFASVGGGGAKKPPRHASDRRREAAASEAAALAPRETSTFVSAAMMSESSEDEAVAAARVQRERAVAVSAFRYTEQINSLLLSGASGDESDVPAAPPRYVSQAAAVVDASADEVEDPPTLPKPKYMQAAEAVLAAAGETSDDAEV